jgi:hypothetical protein
MGKGPEGYPGLRLFRERRASPAEPSASAPYMLGSEVYVSELFSINPTYPGYTNSSPSYAPPPWA